MLFSSVYFVVCTPVFGGLILLCTVTVMNLKVCIPRVDNSEAIVIITSAWPAIRKSVDKFQKVILKAYVYGLEQYDKHLVDKDAQLPISSVFRPSNRFGQEGIFASADNWLKSINTPNFDGATVEAYCKLRSKPLDFMVDWALRHPDLLPNLGAWGREWLDDYPRFSEIMAEKLDHTGMMVCSHTMLCNYSTVPTDMLPTALAPVFKGSPSNQYKHSIKRC